MFQESANSFEENEELNVVPRSNSGTSSEDNTISTRNNSSGSAKHSTSIFAELEQSLFDNDTQKSFEGLNLNAKPFSLTPEITSPEMSYLSSGFNEDLYMHPFVQPLNQKPSVTSSNLPSNMYSFESSDIRNQSPSANPNIPTGQPQRQLTPAQLLIQQKYANTPALEPPVSAIPLTPAQLLIQQKYANAPSMEPLLDIPPIQEFLPLPQRPYGNGYPQQQDNGYYQQPRPYVTQPPQYPYGGMPRHLAAPFNPYNPHGQVGQYQGGGYQQQQQPQSHLRMIQQGVEQFTKHGVVPMKTYGKAPVINNTIYYQVQFKLEFRYFVPHPLYLQHNSPLQINDFVIVECEKGEDIGVVVKVLNHTEYNKKRLRDIVLNDDSAVRFIIRQATMQEREMLPYRFQDELIVVEHANKLIAGYGLPMMVMSAQYQSDRTKLFIYYTSKAHLNFKHLITELFTYFHTPVWFRKLHPKQTEELFDAASVALETGLNVVM